MKWRWIPLLLVSSVFGDALREMSFDEKVSAASVVLIGQVESLQPRSEYPAWAEIKVESILKGTASPIIRVESHGLIGEAAVPMTVGRRYLFMLGLNDDIYYSVNGHFAVIPVDGKPQ